MQVILCFGDDGLVAQVEADGADRGSEAGAVVAAGHVVCRLNQRCRCGALGGPGGADGQGQGGKTGEGDETKERGTGGGMNGRRVLKGSKAGGLHHAV